MTRKDYILIASALQAAGPYGELKTDRDNGYMEGWRAAVSYVEDALASDNPRFDRARFLKACGVQS